MDNGCIANTKGAKAGWSSMIRWYDSCQSQLVGTKGLANCHSFWLPSKFQTNSTKAVPILNQSIRYWHSSAKGRTARASTRCSCASWYSLSRASLGCEEATAHSQLFFDVPIWSNHRHQEHWACTWGRNSCNSFFCALAHSLPSTGDVALFLEAPLHTAHEEESRQEHLDVKAWALIFCGGMEVIQPSWSYPGCLPRHNLIVPSYHESACLVNQHRGTVWSLASTPWAILTAHKATSNSDLQQCIQYTTGSEILNLGTKGGFCLLRTESIPCNPSAVSTLVAKSGVSACQPKVLVWFDEWCGMIFTRAEGQNTPAGWTKPSPWRRLSDTLEAKTFYS